MLEPATRRAELRQLFGVARDRFVVGWIGRMTAIKRVPDILAGVRARCASAASTRRSASSATAPTATRSSSCAHELGISRRRLFVGYQRDVAPYYAFFDALAARRRRTRERRWSRSRRSPPGRPVVATRVGGVPDVVDDGEDGFLVDVGDVEAIADALEQLARDPELRRAMGAAGRARVVPRYRVERLIDDVDALYRELLTDSGLPQPPSA